ncbi:hypothetical protein [Pseudomonas paraveronii]|uniref:hypothetical protein n=1 Tax=Pseudomonas paraveronii TaxID=3040598 RepID=UPI002AB1DA62|nr:hypothetical protein [Pseudomonas sp. FLM 11]
MFLHPICTLFAAFLHPICILSAVKLHPFCTRPDHYTAAAVDGDLEKGSQIAQKATTFNYLYHKEVEEMLREVDSKSTEQEKRAVRERYAALDQQRNDELDALCARDPQRCRAIAISLANDDQKLVDLVGKLRSQGQGGAASAVGFVIGSNLDASSKIAADISSAGGGVLVKLGAEAIKAGVGVTLPSRSGAGKGKGSQGEAAGPDVPQGAKEVAGTTATSGTKVAATEGTFPDEVFTGKKPHQTTPGIGSVTPERYNPATGKLEESVIEYDQYGRQVKRTDYTNHGYGNQEKPAEYHSDPHTHTYEYGPGYGSNGKETRINND